MKSPLLVIPLVASISPWCLFAGSESGDRESADWAARVAYAENKRDANIREVRSIRRYVLHNARWKNDGTATVLVTSDVNGHKRYSFLDSHLEGIQKQILQRILDGEVETAVRKDEDPSISPRNYEMTP